MRMKRAARQSVETGKVGVGPNWEVTSGGYGNAPVVGMRVIRRPIAR